MNCCNKGATWEGKCHGRDDWVHGGEVCKAIAGGTEQTDKAGVAKRSSKRSLPRCVGRHKFTGITGGACATYADENRNFCSADGALPTCSECGRCSDDGDAVGAFR